MHTLSTTDENGTNWRIHFNSDLDGDAHIVCMAPLGTVTREITVPGELILMLVMRRTETMLEELVEAIGERASNHTEPNP